MYRVYLKRSCWVSPDSFVSREPPSPCGTQSCSAGSCLVVWVCLIGKRSQFDSSLSPAGQQTPAGTDLTLPDMERKLVREICNASTASRLGRGDFRILSYCHKQYCICWVQKLPTRPEYIIQEVFKVTLNNHIYKYHIYCNISTTFSFPFSVGKLEVKMLALLW